MTLKLGLMHNPRLNNRLPAEAVDFYAPRRSVISVGSSMEFLVRLRETRRRTRRSWKGD